MKKLIVFLFVGFVLSSFGVYAQHDLSDSEIDDLRVRIEEKLNDFQYDLEILAGKNGNSLSTKRARMEVTLRLFIGEGDGYFMPEPDGKGGFVNRWHEPVTMSRIKSKHTGERDTIPMRQYLESLIRQSQYRRIKITQAEGVRVDTFHKVSDNRYVATAHILQGFVRYNSEGKIIYTDTTGKKVTVYLDRIIQPGPDGTVLEYWEIKLGNVEAETIW